MNFDTIESYAHSLYNQYPVAIAIVVLILLVIIYKSPKKSFKFALLLLCIVAFFYTVGLFRGLVSTGIQNKGQMIHKSK